MCYKNKFLYKSNEIKIACIFDEFTFSTYKSYYNLYNLPKKNWKKIFDTNKINFFICESAWSGYRNEWRCSIYHDISNLHDNRSELLRIIKYCNANGIMTIFINKEDPIYYRNSNYNFTSTSLYFNKIFTSSKECVVKYKEDYNLDVLIITFSFNPLIYNPFECFDNNNYSEKNIVFFGSWYGDIEQRCNDLFIIKKFLTNNNFNLKIHDRFSEFNNINNKWPDDFTNHINKSVSIELIPRILKNYDYGLNINSVINSDTMFARRMFELAASGKYVFSNYSKGIKKIFKKNVYLIRNADEKFNLDNITIKLNIISNIFNVFNKYTSKQVFDKMFRQIKMYKNDNISKYIYFMVNGLSNTNINNINMITNIYGIKNYILDKEFIILSKYIISDPMIRCYLNHFSYNDKIILISNEIDNFFKVTKQKINLEHVYLIPIKLIDNIFLDVFEVYNLPNINYLNVIVKCNDNCNNLDIIKITNTLKKIKLKPYFFDVYLIVRKKNIKKTSKILNKLKYNNYCIVSDSEQQIFFDNMIKSKFILELNNTKLKYIITENMIYKMIINNIEIKK